MPLRVPLGTRQKYESKQVDGQVHYSPPLKAFLKISQDFPELTFEIDFWGVGSGFCGTFAYRDGECVFGEFFEHDEYDALFSDRASIEAAHDLAVSDEVIDTSFVDESIQNFWENWDALPQQQ